MASIILVAGKSTVSLKKFLEERGSLEVIHSYDSLHNSSDKLLNGIFRADKLVYLYQDNINDIRLDMRLLVRLLTTDSFFRVNEIVFFTTKSTEEISSLKFFKALMDEVEWKSKEDSSIFIPEYTIQESQKELSYASIYNVLLGMAESIQLDREFYEIYRVERDSESNNAYEENDFEEVKFEPFSYKRLSNYEIVKESARKTETAEVISSSEKEIKKGNPSFNEISIPRSNTVNCIVVGGNRKAGVSTFSIALASSLVSKGEKVIIFELTKNRSMELLLNSYSLIYTKVDCRRILSNEEIDFQPITLIEGYKDEIAVYLLKSLIGNVNQLNIDSLIIDCHEENFNEAINLTKSLDSKVLLLSEPNKKDIENIKLLFDKVKDADLILSKLIETELKIPDMNPEEIRIIIKNIRRMISPIIFPNLALDSYLADKILEE